MICTESFTFNSPFEQYKICLEDHYVDIDYNYDDELLEKNANYLWNKRKDNIIAYLEGALNLSSFLEFNWNIEVEVCKLLLGKYIESSIANPEIFVSFETYWRELMMKALETDIENFEKEGLLFTK